VQVGGAGGTAEDVVLNIEYQEEHPELTHVCKGDGAGAPYISVQGDVHQGGYILTREQVKYLQEKCHFLEHFSASRDYMSSYSLYDPGRNASSASAAALAANVTSKPGYEPQLPHCGMQKIIPGESFSAFHIYHYFQSEEGKKDPKPTPIFRLEEEIRSG
jgi:hypothetical protein